VSSALVKYSGNKQGSIDVDLEITTPGHTNHIMTENILKELAAIKFLGYRQEGFDKDDALELTNYFIDDHKSLSPEELLGSVNEFNSAQAEFLCVNLDYQTMYGMSVANSRMNSFYAGNSLYREFNATNLTQLGKSLLNFYKTYIDE
jgi:hypothetical protein